MIRKVIAVASALMLVVSGIVLLWEAVLVVTTPQGGRFALAAIVFWWLWKWVMVSRPDTVESSREE